MGIVMMVLDVGRGDSTGFAPSSFNGHDEGVAGSAAVVDVHHGCSLLHRGWCHPPVGLVVVVVG